MEPFDYVTILLSIVISLALAHLLGGIATMIRNGVRRISLPLLHWIVFSLFLCVDYWFTIWGARSHETWSLQYVLLLLVQASGIYIIASLVVPSPHDNKPIDLTAFFEGNRRKFMGTMLVTISINEITNLTIQGFNTSLLGLMVLAWAVLFVIGWQWASQKVQLAICVINIAMTTYYAMNFIPAL